MPEVTGQLWHDAASIGPFRLSFGAGRPGEFFTTMTIPATGSWRLVVQVRTTAIDIHQAETTIQVL